MRTSGGNTFSVDDINPQVRSNDHLVLPHLAETSDIPPPVPSAPPPEEEEEVDEDLELLPPSYADCVTMKKESPPPSYAVSWDL